MFRCNLGFDALWQPGGKQCITFDTTGGLIVTSFFRSLSMLIHQLFLSTLDFSRFSLLLPPDALLEPYDGSHIGVYFQVELDDEEFRQYMVPLNTLQ